MAARRHAAPARLLVLPGLRGMLAAVSLIVWVGPQLAAGFSSGRLEPVGFWQAQGAVTRVLLGSRPTLAYPVALRRAFPVASEFWLVQGLLSITVVALAGAGLSLELAAGIPIRQR